MNAKILKAARDKKFPTLQKINHEFLKNLISFELA